MEAELDRLQEGVIRTVDHLEWAALILPVLRSTGAAKICGDNKMAVKPSCQSGQVPDPQHTRFVHEIDGWSTVHKTLLKARLSTSCTRRRLVQAHHHQQLKDSCKLTTINNSKTRASSPPSTTQRLVQAHHHQQLKDSCKLTTINNSKTRASSPPSTTQRVCSSMNVVSTHPRVYP